MNYSINIIGYGFVGKAIGHLMTKNNINFNVHDIILNTSTLKDLIKKSELNTYLNVYFVCVPTPSMSSGDCDTSIVESVIADLSCMVTQDTVVIIKSTVKPGFTKLLSAQYRYIQIVFCPEFLREISANEDIYNTNFVLCSVSYYNKYVVDLFTNVLYKHNPDFKCYTKTSEECELFKYTINTFLAIKVWYFNEIHCLCEKMNIDYQEFKTLFPLDPRIGEYGTTVPNNGNFGFSGSCLPKEIRAMTQVQRDLDIPNSVLQEIIKRNNIFLEK